jgi:hypothetical protein
VIDAHTLEKEWSSPAAQCRSASPVPNGKLALVSCAQSGEVAVIETAGRREWKRIRCLACRQSP